MDLLTQLKLKKVVSKFNLKLIYILSIFFLIISCSPQTRYEVLSFLFDGVPKPELDSLKNESISIADSILLANKKKEEEKVIVSKMKYHSPFADKSCSQCHNTFLANKLLMSEPELCYQCHDKMENEYAVLHGPISSGYCTQCHQPHQSEFEHLATREGQKLCFYCHKSEDVLKNSVHEDIGETSCWSCHNPHGGSDRFIMN